MAAIRLAMRFAGSARLASIANRAALSSRACSAVWHGLSQEGKRDQSASPAVLSALESHIRQAQIGAVRFYTTKRIGLRSMRKSEGSEADGRPTMSKTTTKEIEVESTAVTATAERKSSAQGSDDAFRKMDEASVYGTDPQESVLTADVGQYLAKVYGTLGLTVGSAAAATVIGSMTSLGFAFGPSSPMFYSIGAIIPIMAVSFSSPSAGPWRMAALQTSAVMMGLGMAPFIGMIAAVNPAIVATALGGTGAIFGGFTLMALKARRRSALMLGGPLLGGMLGIMVLQLAPFVFDMSPGALKALHSVYTYGGLGLFSLFIAYDTQRMIENARAGQKDVVGDALNMFLNLRGVFVMLLSILSSRD